MKGKRRCGEKREKMQIFECDVVRVGLYIFFVQFCFRLSAYKAKFLKESFPPGAMHTAGGTCLERFQFCCVKSINHKLAD